jgi:iron complex outermembrane receptor protein
MKKISIGFFAVIIGLFLVIGGVPWVCAQERAIDEFTLEEITVTAEKREVYVQDIPASVQALVGANLMEQGRITTSQMLETVPNVLVEGGFNNAGIQASTPDAGISIRGVRYKQTSDGQPAAATATYVDGVFQGYGGNLDIERIEVLRGPQGTLYGRSATGGVVAFHTYDPILEEFSGFVSGEFGRTVSNLMVPKPSSSYKNVQTAVNVPVSDFFALRAAARLIERDGPFNASGGYLGIRDGRVKSYFKPNDALDMLLSLTVWDTMANSGGTAARLLAPGGPIDYYDTETDVVVGAWRRGTMGALTVNYNFSKSILTYIGSMRYYEDLDSPPATMIRPGAQIMHNQFYKYGEHFRTHELRLASDSEGPLAWLVGVNYYNSDYDRYQVSMNHIAYVPDLGGIEDPDPDTRDAPIFEQPARGEITNYGIFTEETYDVSDVFRITAGLRFDKTEVDAYSAFNMNTNENEWRNARNPAIWEFYGLEDSVEFDNITYKLRFEYDLTPDSMLYLLSATGFQPGDIRLTNKFDPTIGGFVFFTLPYDEEELLAFEAGSKNRLLDDRLQVNFSVFYYDYDGFTYTVNTALGGPPVFNTLPIPLRMIGDELTIDWLVTANDKVTFNVGAVDAKITGYPSIAELNPTKQWMELERLPGIAPLSANLGYEHTFYLDSGATIVPRGEIRYTDGMYIENLTTTALAAGLLPYAYQDAYIIGDIGTTWTSPSGNYSATAYLRNALDKEYITGVNVESGVDSVGVTTGDPRTFGIMFRARF